MISHRLMALGLAFILPAAHAHSQADAQKEPVASPFPAAQNRRDRPFVRHSSSQSG